MVHAAWSKAICSSLPMGVRLSRSTAAVSLTCWLTIGWSPAHAQQSAGAIRGVVLSRDSTPVVNALVSVSPGTGIARTDQAGAFTIRGLEAQRYELAVRVVGYEPRRLPVSVQAGRTTELVVVLQPFTLETVTVSAVRAALPRVADRERRGGGAVMYRDEIAKLPLYSTTDVLQFSSRFRLGNRDQIIFVDGRVPRNIRYDLPHKDDIAAIEAWRGYAAIREPDLWLPRNQQLSASVTVIMIWTVQYMRRAQLERDTLP
jgi:hypothetical protein